MTNAAITGWGRYTPPTVLSNDDLEQLTDTSDEWITSRTGIKERRISHIATSDMANIAGRRALAAAGLEPEDLDLVMLATCTGDTVIPSPAALLQAKLGAANAAAFDLNAACSGWLYGIDVATSMIRVGRYRRILLVGAERLSHYLDFSNRSTAVLFGDGAGAIVLEATTGDEGILATTTGADGSVAEILWVPGVGTSGDRFQSPNHSDYGVIMDGPEVFRRAVTTMGEAAMQVVTDAGLDVADIDLLIPHQANIRIIDATARRLKLRPEQVYINIQSYGNTSAATIPIALSEAVEQGRVEPGSVLVFAAFGAGLTWAATTVRWGARVDPIADADIEVPPPPDGDVFDLLRSNIEFFGTGVPE